MDYGVVKLVHQGAVALSLLGFFARGAASLTGAAWVRRPAARRWPHVIDTVLLLSALLLAWMLRLQPAQAPWLLAKIGGLLLYIGLGVVALRPGLPWRWRAGAWLAALATAGWIVSIAVTKSPWGFLASLSAGV
jgi:uncharacterized membrane protein SirB2